MDPIILGSLFFLFALLSSVGYYFFRFFIQAQNDPEKLESQDTKSAKPEDSSTSQIREESAQALSEPIVTPAEVKVESRSIGTALQKTKLSFSERLRGIFASKKLSDEIRDELEEILYTSDLGPHAVERLLDAVQSKLKEQGGELNFERMSDALKNEMRLILNQPQPLQLFPFSETPQVWMIVGVNGAGKTTTIGKLAHQIVSQGHKVMVAAGDTFRAAAPEQLKVWSERAQVEIFHSEQHSDPSAVAFDACQKAKAQGFDVVLVDTAGRLHTQKNLMEELKKMKRVLTKISPNAPQQVLLVLDSNNGQNALIQAKNFHEALGVTGVILTKLDGTAKGGVALGVAEELKLPIVWVGVGESIEDLKPFSTQEFVDSIL